MPVITLPDGATRDYAAPVAGTRLTADIGKRLAKDALAIKVDGVLRDLSYEIGGDAAIEVVTRGHPEALALLRHDAAHVLAEAVQELYPETQVTFGPATEDGFYYDFARAKPFTPEDLAAIEARMHEIVVRDEPLVREIWPRGKAIAHFASIGETYKAEHIESLPEDAEISIYRQGGWLDLCLGPHLPSTGRLGHAFKLLRISGAYWRGDAGNRQLQRVYGTAWETREQLEAYLTQLEEAAKRDHRRLGRELQLFHQQEEAVGSTFWHPRGWQLWRSIEDYLRRKLKDGGYLEVKSPQLYDRLLWEASGHWEKFREQMFIAESEQRMLAVKPMNCPGHVLMFRQGIKSYRDLPLRFAEFGSCHRNEPSGALHGLMRVRAFTQDDGHIFCRPDQVVSETETFCALLLEIYRAFGFEEVRVKFSDRPERRAGSDETWDRAEAALMEATEAAGLEFASNPGEGAFYGPKLEFVLKDAIGRDWQCGTFQVDFVMPERLGAVYTGEDGGKHRPVMLHRAILGSFERFIAILIENFAGRFPLWLAPRQVTVATVTDAADGYAEEAVKALQAAGLRAEADLRNEKINAKIRDLSLAKVPAIAVVGRKEADNRSVALRRLGGKTQEVLALEAAVAKLAEEARPPA
ncbi:MAG: threonine--tRNA ligase [Rhodospirillales bacterium]|nr:threonine--tRNA ligase [Rhodospirillales bacterium]